MKIEMEGEVGGIRFRLVAEGEEAKAIAERIIDAALEGRTKGESR